MGEHLSNQTAAIKRWLEKGNKLTSAEAFEKFGCTRLAAKIFELKRDGYDIIATNKRVKNRYGRITYVAEYELKR